MEIRPTGDGPGAAAYGSRRTRRRIRRYLLIYLGLTPFVVIAIFPVYWMAITAFKEDADLYRMDLVPFWFLYTMFLDHFIRGLTASGAS
jgi:ABC-type glycerol-3-phosphate transport system permease component